MRRIIAITTAAILAGIAGSAHAQAADSLSTRISYADLDLSRASGRAVLNQRVDHAVMRVCGERPAPVELSRAPAWQACRSAAIASAKPQLAQAFGGTHLADATVTLRAGGH